jgi:cell division initiation protein
MRISPIDIQQQQFKSRPFGYEKAGVDQFLEVIAEELERLMRKNHDLQEELARTKAMLTEMRDREETLKATLLTTQKVTDSLKSTARREVDVMMAEAEIKAERLLHNAEERRLQLIEEIQEIKRQKIDFEVSLRGLLEKHIRMLDLNSVAIEHNVDAKLLEEPLPFVRPQEQKVTKTPSGAADDANETNKTVDEAEFCDDEELQEQYPEAEIQDLSLDYDPEDLNGEEDFHK